jgi:predicted short-subunit dehydrogenase-like oxidoreductase (DUF2520 family)
MTPVRMAIVGTGRVAQAFGRLLRDAGLPPVAVGGRTVAHAERAASFISHLRPSGYASGYGGQASRPSGYGGQAPPNSKRGGQAQVRAASIAEIPSLADHVLIAVSDAAIAEVADELARGGMTGGVALHTSGARGPQLLEPLAARGVSCGVIHPLQTIADPSRGVAALRGATFGVSGDAAAVEWARELVDVAAGTSLRIRAEAFASYHAGAVMAGNAVIAAIDAAVVLLGAAGVEKRAALQAIRPLCLTSAQNALDLGPEAALTGPVQRGDAETIRAHVEALASCPPYVADLYRASGHALVDIARRRGLPEASAHAVEEALDG